MTQLGEAPMVYYKAQIKSTGGEWWLTVESTPFSVEHLQECIDGWKAKGRETRILKVEVTGVKQA